MVAKQAPLPFLLSAKVPQSPTITSGMGRQEMPPQSPIRGARDIFPLPNSKPLSQDQINKENLILSYLKEQYRPVSLTEMAMNPLNKENGKPVIGDYETAGGLGLPVSQLRLVLQRLHQQRRVTRLPPRDRETAHLWVEGWQEVE